MRPVAARVDAVKIVRDHLCMVPSIWVCVAWVRQMLLEAFAEHDSHSLQHTLYAIREAVVNNFENVGKVHLSLPNNHFNLVDLAPLGTDNPGAVFLPADQPHGLIEATLRKD